MKKTYINPTIEVIELKSRTVLMAGSLGIGEAGSANDAESRESDFDDEF